MTLDHTARHSEVRIVVAANFTFEPIEDALTFWLEQLSIDYSLTFASFNQIFQQLLDRASDMSRNTGGINIFLIRVEEWLSGSHDACRGNVRKQAESFISALETAAEQTFCTFLVCICPRQREC